MTTLMKFDNETGNGSLYSQYTGDLLFECMHTDLHKFNAIERAVRMAEKLAIAHAKQVISDAVKQTIDKA